MLPAVDSSVARSLEGMGTGDFTTREEVSAVYRRRARHYDVSANLYYLVGFREFAYRRMAVEALALRPGGTVVEVGCGTGLNFSLLERKVGPEGRIIGVDLTPEMLEVARRRVAEKGWRNVTLVHSAAADYAFPDGVEAILSTFALTLEPDYERVIARGAGALRPGGRWVILDLKQPDSWLRRLTPLFVPLVRPFAVSLALAERRPWEALARHTTRVTMKELYLGFAYLAAGEA